MAEDLMVKYNKRSVPVIQGDTVKVIRGNFRNHIDKVRHVNLKRQHIEVEGVVTTKVDGSKVPRPVHPSNVVITKLNLTDPWRRERLERGLSEEVKREIEQEAQRQIEEQQEAEQRREEEALAAKAEEEKTAELTESFDESGEQPEAPLESEEGLSAPLPHENSLVDESDEPIGEEAVENMKSEESEDEIDMTEPELTTEEHTATTKKKTASTEGKEEVEE
jgi:large subunit ribosomal protein L24